MTLHANASARDAVQFALAVLEGLGSAIPGGNEQAKMIAIRDLQAWLANPDGAGAKLKARIDQRMEDYGNVGWLSSDEPMQSNHANGLGIEHIHVEDDHVSWFDWHGEPIALAASLLAQKLDHSIVLHDLHDAGNGHLSAKWKRVLP